MDIRLMSVSDGEAVRALWDESFDDNPKAFSDWFFANKYIAENTLGLYDGGELISTLQMIPYSFYLRGRVVRGASIVGVCTRADMRGRGYGKVLMDASNEILALRGQSIATLYPSISYDFYRRLGWEVCTERLRLNVKRGALATGMPQREVRPCGCDDMISIYERAVAYHNLAAVRDSVAWERRLSEILCDGGEALVGYLDDIPHAYALYHAEDGCAEIDEAVYDDITAMMSIVRRLLETHERCIVNIGTDSAFNRLLRDGRGDVALEPFLMARCTDVSGLLSQLPWPDGADSLAVEITDGGRAANSKAFLLHNNKGSIAVGQAGDADIKMGINQLVGVISGFADIDNYIALGAAQARSAECVDRLKALFPSAKTAGFEMY